MRKFMAFLVGMALASAVAVHADTASTEGLLEKDIKVLDKAPEVLQSLTTTPDKGIPRHLLDRAECVVVFPSVTKAAFVVGGEFGRGVATCRKGTTMGAPALFTLASGSVGWQVGGEQTDFVLLVMDKNGMDQLLKDEFKIGGDASVAAGPVGRNAEASTNLTLGSQMLSWSRSRGLFAGASLEGGVMKPNKEANRRLYGHDMSAREILEGNASVPQAASHFVEVASNVLLGTESTARAVQGRNYGQEPSRLSYEQTAPNTRYKSSHLSGTVVSLSANEVVIRMADGSRKTVKLDGATRVPQGVHEGSTIYLDVNDNSGELVATRIAENELPRTASQLPALFVAGSLLLLAALALRLRARHAA